MNFINNFHSNIWTVINLHVVQERRPECRTDLKHLLDLINPHASKLLYLNASIPKLIFVTKLIFRSKNITTLYSKVVGLN